MLVKGTHVLFLGLAGEYPCRNVDLLSHVSIEDLGYTKAIQDAVGDKK